MTENFTLEIKRAGMVSASQKLAQITAVSKESVNKIRGAIARFETKTGLSVIMLSVIPLAIILALLFPDPCILGI